MTLLDLVKLPAHHVLSPHGDHRGPRLLTFVTFDTYCTLSTHLFPFFFFFGRVTPVHHKQSRF